LDEFQGYEVLVGECVAKEKNGLFQPEIPVSVGFV
jgi:hypothetical protein